jgi:VWFA-related protein
MTLACTARALTLLVAVGTLLYGQRDPRSVGEAAPIWVVDALALDAAGRPVTDLAPGDFEVTLGGKTRKITAFTRFDTVLHSARSAQGLEPALALTPEENRRIFVVVVDDVGLSPEGIVAVRATLRDLAGSVTASGGRLAILRAGGGNGVLRQLSGDSRILTNAIDEIRYLGRADSPASAGRATWQALTFALDGLAETAGRKVVAVLTENPCAPAPPGAVGSDVHHAAHAAGAAVYTLRPGGTAIGEPAATCPLASLAHDTGGLFGGELRTVLEQEQIYYAIGIAQDEDVIDPTGRWSAAKPAEVKALRSGITLRPRQGYVRYVPAADSLLPESYPVVYNRALRSPFAGFALRTRLSATLVDQRDTAIVQAHLFVDPHDLTFTRDLEGTYHGGAFLGFMVYKENVRTPKPIEREVRLNLKAAEMQTALSKGFLTSFEMSLPGPGDWQILAVVADEGSDRTGSAAQFLEVPVMRQNQFRIGGLLLPGDTADPTARRFRRDDTLTYRFTTMNEVAADRKASLEMQTKVLSGTSVVLNGAPLPISFEESPRGSHRQISGTLKLNDLVPPGDYLLQVTVRDLLAPANLPATATQVIDFQVRQ